AHLLLGKSCRRRALASRDLAVGGHRLSGYGIATATLLDNITHRPKSSTLPHHVSHSARSSLHGGDPPRLHDVALTGRVPGFLFVAYASACVAVRSPGPLACSISRIFSLTLHNFQCIFIHGDV